jgi:hypothetical protein
MTGREYRQSECDRQPRLRQGQISQREQESPNLHRSPMLIQSVRQPATPNRTDIHHPSVEPAQRERLCFGIASPFVQVQRQKSHHQEVGQTLCQRNQTEPGSIVGVRTPQMLGLHCHADSPETPSAVMNSRLKAYVMRSQVTRARSAPKKITVPFYYRVVSLRMLRIGSRKQTRPLDALSDCNCEHTAFTFFAIVRHTTVNQSTESAR